MKEIVLTQGKVAVVDDDLYEELNQFNWHALKGKHTFYAKRWSPTIRGKRHPIWMHHEVIGKPPKGFMIDHIKGCGAYNIRKNLRFVTNRQNQQNQIYTNSSSRYPGVNWFKKTQKWMVHIKINGKAKHLGLFTDEKEAFEAYKQEVNDLGEKMVGDAT